MKKYDNYKDSGIEWIGEIPEHWNLKKIKHTTYVKGRIGWKGLRSDEFLELSDSYVVTGTDFENGKIKWKTCYQVPIERYEDDPFIKLKNDDLLITKDGTIGKIAVVKDMPKIATLNSGVFLTRPYNAEYSQEYMYWILFSEVFKTFYDYNKSGSTIQHLYQNVFNEFEYMLPPIDEQKQITNFLDHKTAQIDTLISKKEQFISLLQEERTAVINQAVTKGLDPKVKMKDSGIEWLGEIPEHWEEAKIKNVAKIIGRIGFRGYTIADLVQKGQGAISLSPSNIKNHLLSIDDCTYLSWEKYHESPEIKIYENDIILVKTGSTIGKTAIIPSETPEMTLNPQLVVFKDIKLKPLFLYYMMISNYFQGYFSIYTAGGSTPAISQEKINNFKITFPETEEQIKISNFIAKKELEIKSIITKSQQEIELLKEYKTALISEVVTGKVDIRDMI